MINHERHMFQSLEKRPWEELLREKWGDYQSPLTVHLPIHPPHTPDVMHVGPAMEVSRRRVAPGLDTHDSPEKRLFDTLIVQFAFGKLPVVPDFRRSRLALCDGVHPIAQAEYYTYHVYGGLLDRFEY